MATKALRKKLVADGLVETLEDSLAKITTAEDGSDGEEAVGVAAANPFDLLNEDNNDSSNGETDDAKPEEEARPAKQQKQDKKETLHQQKQQQKASSPSPSSKKQNKKKKKKRTIKKEAQEGDGGEEGDDFAQILQQYGSHGEPAPLKEEQDGSHLLSISPKFLNADAEMTRLFGATVVRSARQPRGRPQPAGRGRKQDRPPGTRRALLIHPQPGWLPMPRDGGGLQIEHVESKQGIDYFRVVWEPLYQKLQQVFLQCVQTGDPETLTVLLSHYPYHVDSLLQLSEACKVTHNMDLSVQFIEQVIFRFEACLHHHLVNNKGDGQVAFDPVRKYNGRLEYKHKENRSFFIGLFRYVQLVDRRGCCRTALELCKLILGMDRSDPVGVLLLLDNLAIRSEEYTFLVSIFQSEDFKQITGNLPNFAFSVALAKHFLENTADTQQTQKTPLASSEELLVQAITRYPFIMIPLLKKLGLNELSVKLTGTESADAMIHPFFLSASSSNSLSPVLQTLGNLFIERNHSFWRRPQVLDWLKQGVKAALIRVDKQTNLEQPQFPLKEEQFRRHFILCDVATEQLPPHVLQNGLQIYNEDDDEQPASSQTTPSTSTSDSTPAASSNPMTSAVHVLALFLQSLMPFYDHQNGGPAPAGTLAAAQQLQQVGAHKYVAGLLQQHGLDVSHTFDHFDYEEYEDW